MNTETFIGNVKEGIQKNTKGEKYLKKDKILLLIQVKQNDCLTHISHKQFSYTKISAFQM